MRPRIRSDGLRLRATPQHEQRIRAAVETGLDHLILLDGDGMVLYASPSVLGMNGFHADDVIGRHALAFVHRHDRMPLRAQFAEVARTPASTVRITCRVRTKSGAWRWIETDISNLLHESRVR